MGGIDFDFNQRWDLAAPWDGALAYHRKRPGRLRDREAFGAVLRAFADVAGSNYSITVNDLDVTGMDALTILNDAGPTIQNLFLQSQSTSDLWVVQFYSRPSPVTVVRGPMAQSMRLNRLIVIVDAHTRWLGLRGWAARIRPLRWMAPSVVQRATRDARRDARTRWIAIVFGFVGGVIASVLGALVTAVAGRS